MKILHLNSYDLVGGAAIAANRLHNALRASGQTSQMGVLFARSDDPDVKVLGGAFYRKIFVPIFNKLERMPEKVFYSKPEYPGFCSFSCLPGFIHHKINKIPKDITHLHWVTDGFLSPYALKRLHKPVVWTLHDTWAFTGGCHFFKSCEGYKSSCGECPELCSKNKRDLSSLGWTLKNEAYKKIKPNIITPSKAFAKYVASSGLLSKYRLRVIPNCIDTSIFKPILPAQAREILNLPPSTPILLFGAVGGISDYRKGFDLLLKALALLQKFTALKPICCVLGQGHGPSFPNLPYEFRYLGKMSDSTTLALAYSAANVFLCPSREDNLPNTIMESLACGTPALAFNVGGIPDMIEHNVNGFLANPFDTEEFASLLGQLLNNPNLQQSMGVAGRNKVLKEFAMPVVAKQHVAFYEEVLEEHNS